MPIPITPAIPNPRPISPALQQQCFNMLKNSHTLEHQAVAQLKEGRVVEAKMTLQRQIQVLVTVLAIL